jgi:hypothetical protein
VDATYGALRRLVVPIVRTGEATSLGLLTIVGRSPSGKNETVRSMAVGMSAISIVDGAVD